MWSEVVLVLQGASRVAQTVVKMGCEELRMATATSTLGSGIKSLQSTAEHCVSTVFTNLQVNKSDSRARPSSSDFDADSWSVMSELPPAEDVPPPRTTPGDWQKKDPSMTGMGQVRTYSTIRGLTADEIQRARETKLQGGAEEHGKPKRQKVGDHF